MTHWFFMAYLCEDCDIYWQDKWTSITDDDCPKCGKNSMPIEVSDWDDPEPDPMEDEDEC